MVDTQSWLIVGLYFMVMVSTGFLAAAINDVARRMDALELRHLEQLEDEDEDWDADAPDGEPVPYVDWHKPKWVRLEE